MSVAGLFAGIGGIELGLSSAGHETALLCDAWAPARAVLSNRFPGVPLHGDIHDLRSLPSKTTMVTAGFPCQDLSQAGQTRGIDGSRSGLVGQVFRLLDDQNVPLVMLENVSFMLQLDRGAAIRRLVEAFEDRGYRWAYRVVNSLAFLPQRRERVYFMASKGDVNPWEILFADDVAFLGIETELDTHAHGFYWTEGIRGLGWAADSIPTLKNGSTIGIPSPPAILLPDGAVVKPDLRDAERLQGFPTDWTVAASLVSRASTRWSLVGNAVSVPVAKWLGERIARPGEYDTDRDRPLAGNRWPSAARGDAGTRLEVEIGKFPLFAPRPMLHEFLQYPGTPLSARATRGFLKRMETGSLRFRPGFRERVHAHLATVEQVPIAAE